MVTSLASIDGNLFLGTHESDAGNVYRSIDDGSTWSNAHLFNNGVFLISGEAGVVYVGAYLNGLHRSTDGGQSWSQVAGGLPTSGSFAAMAAEGNSLFVASNEFSNLQIYRSTDGGSTWSAPPGSPLCQARSMLSANGSVFVGTISQGILRSTDGGSTWGSVNTGLPSNPIAGSLALDEDGTSLLAGIYVTSSAPALGLYRSTNSGATWTKVSTDLPTNMQLRFTSILVRPGSIYGGLSGRFGGAGVYRSTDSGVHWTQIAGTLPVSPEIEALTWHQGALFAGTPLGAYRTMDDGVQWTYASHGAAAIRGVASLLDVGDVLYVGLTKNSGSGRGVWRTSDLGETWAGDPAMPENNTAARALLRTGTDLLAAFYGVVRGVYRSSDGGATWTPSTTGIATGTNLNTLFQSGGVHFAGAYEALYRSTTGGASWSAVPGIDNVKTMAELSGVLYAGRYGTGMLRSTDQGLTWSVINTGLPNNNARYVNALAVFNGALYAGTQGSGIYRWTGASWTPSGLPSQFVACLLPVNGLLLAGASLDGVSVTEDGATWSPFNESLSPDDVTQLAAVSGFLVAGTDGDALWARPLSELPGSAGIEGATVMMTGLLRQNEPNPFGVATRIAWRIPEAGEARLDLFDPSGRHVRRIAAGRMEAGDHEVALNASGLPAGVYYYRLQLSGRGETKKLVVVP